MGSWVYEWVPQVAVISVASIKKNSYSNLETGLGKSYSKKSTQGNRFLLISFPLLKDF
jgi:hypothetical protein